MNVQNAIIETRDLSFSIGETQILKNVSLMVPQGSIYGFLGPNGAGKTTLIRILLNLYNGGGNKVFLFGKDVTQNRVSVLGRVGRFVEQPSLYSHLSGADNLNIAREYYGVPSSRVDIALHLVGMSDFRNRKVKAYSLGMRQRIAIGQALIHDPELLILDEPTNGLDPSGIKEIRELLVSLNKTHGKTIFISSHNLSEIEKMCSHVGVIHHGKILYQGPKDALPTTSGAHLEVKVGDTAGAMAILKRHGMNASHTNNSILSVDIENENQISAVNRILVENGADVYSLGVLHGNLEETFISLTNDSK